jgi:hypothetical protein
MHAIDLFAGERGLKETHGLLYTQPKTTGHRRQIVPQSVSERTDCLTVHPGWEFVSGE